MPKIVTLDPINVQTAIKTNDNLLSGMLQSDLQVMQECGGRGLCATCHVFVKEGMEALSPVSRREQRTLEVITTCRTNSRLACQARVLGEGIVLELPAGTYVNQIDDIESLIGRRAQDNILHPLTGQILVEAGKLITRSMITQLEDTRSQTTRILATTDDV